jgi:hypothetical protein
MHTEHALPEIAALPRVFEATAGLINHSLIKEICRAVPHPSKQVRGLLSISGVKLKQQDDVYVVLSEHIISKDFRDRWYVAAESKRIKLTSLFLLAGQYVQQRHKNVNFYSPALDSFFTKRIVKGQNLTFPVLERIDVLINELEKVFKVSATDAALAAWSLTEHCRWAATRLANEPSLINFRPALLQGLQARSLSGLEALLEPATWQSCAPQPTCRPPKAVLPEIVHADLPPTPEKRNPSQIFMQDIDNRFGVLTESMAAYEQLCASISNAASALKRANNADDAIADLKAQLQELGESLKQVEQLATLAEDFICSTLDAAAERFNAKIYYPPAIAFSPLNANKWVAHHRANLAQASSLINIADRAVKATPAVQQEIASNQSQQSLRLDEVATFVTEKNSEITVVEDGIRALTRLHTIIETNYTDLKWSPFHAGDFHSSEWRALGIYLIRQGKFGIVLGIILRNNFETLANAFTSAVDAILPQISQEEFENLFATLRYLNLGQIEELYTISGAKSRNRLLSATLLHAHLETIERSKTEAFVYWSTRPLNDYTQKYTDDPNAKFYQTLYQHSGADVEPSLNLTVFRKLLSQARLETPDVQSNHKHELGEQVRHILRYHKRGGNTYAELWLRAHSSVFLPLRELADCSHFTELLIAIDRLDNDFDIEDHLPTWKTFIHEHLHKRSEYDKHIRAQVRSKIDELHEWAESFRACSAGIMRPQTTFSDVIEAIKGITDGSDVGGEILTKWFEFVLKTNAQRTYVPWSTSRTLSPSLEQSISNNATTNPFAPRLRASQSPTHLHALSDGIIAALGYHTTENLATNYADLGMYESYFALAAMSSDGFSPDLDRRVEEAVDNLASIQSKRIDSLEERVTFDQDEGFHLYISDLRRYLEEQSWSKLEVELAELERFAQNLDAQREELHLRKKLESDIRRLEGTTTGKETIAELRDTHRTLYQNTAARRRHVESVALLSRTENVHYDIVEAASAAIVELETTAKLPSEEHSAYISYVLDQALIPVAEELSRHKTLIPSYVSKLRRLALMLIRNTLSPDFLETEDSPFLRVLEESADHWKNLAKRGKDAIDVIERQFIARGMVFNDGVLSDFAPWISEFSSMDPVGDDILLPSPSDEVVMSASFDKLSALTERLLAADSCDELDNARLRNYIQDARWDRAAKAAFLLHLEQEDKQSARSIDLRANWMISLHLLNETNFDVEDYAVLFRLLNSNPSSTAFRAIAPTKNSKGLAGEIIVRFLHKLNTHLDVETVKLPVNEVLNGIAEKASLLGRLRTLVEIAFAPCGDHDAVIAHALWDYFSGDPKQAEIRSALMNLFWKCSVPSALACCLTYNSPEISRRKANALGMVADQALSSGRFELLESFFDLKKHISSKPFHLFVETMHSRVPRQTEPPAEFRFVGKIEKTQEGDELQAILHITPRKSDCPDTLTLLLPREAPVRFHNKQLSLELVGPFLEPVSKPISLVLSDANARAFRLELGCSAVSITGKSAKFSVSLEIDIAGSDVFRRLSSDDIEDAFDSFPEYQMRGSEYVPRADDERKIERSLFGSKTVRSLWIASPRRSGKTTMLYRILDAYSHKVRRDAIVAYLTLDRSFNQASEFNDWIWTRLRTISANKELREMYSNFDDLGRDLPWTADAGTFIGTLADRLLAGTAATRIIFLIDEVDKFASMHFAGGALKEASSEIMWQLRQLIGERRDVGIVFAGSSAARRLFVTNADAPFFNSITLLELIPFSCRTATEELTARAIIEPRKIASRHVMPRESLEHLLWVCAGIPYYMKLVAGATAGVARQSHILISDINDGLRALLRKSTGVVKLDEMSGEPGSDELRSMAIENGDDKFLTLAVLYTVAETYSALGGHSIYRANLLAQDCPLIVRYGLRNRHIDRGLQLCVELGLLRQSAGRDPSLHFAIPILGESIRNSVGKLWSTIDHEVKAIGEKGAAVNV